MVFAFSLAAVPTSGSIPVTLGVYCVLIVAASLLGGSLPALMRLTHKRMQLLISFVGGLMLGIGVFHMLPHALAELGPRGIDRTMISMMMGLIVMFFLLRTFHFHNHDPTGIPGLNPAGTQAPGSVNPAAHQHGIDHGSGHSHHPGEGACDHDHGHGHQHDHGHEHSAKRHELSWLGVFIGLSLHTLLDGIALGASLRADAMHGFSTLVMGLGTFVAIVLHKPLDAISITALMRAGKWPLRTQIAVNATFALMCPIGALLFLYGTHALIEQQQELVGTALAFSAGVFLCISLSDLLPEMEFHSHHRVPLSLSLLAGILLAWCIRYLEPNRAHQFPAGMPAVLPSEETTGLQIPIKIVEISRNS